MKSQTQPQTPLSSLNNPFDLPLVIPNPPESLNSNFHDQSKCKICGITLKLTNIQSRYRLRQCKFCYEGVCDPCSGLKVYHLYLKRPKRICIACINTNIEQSIQNALNKEWMEKRKVYIDALNAEKKEIKGIQRVLGKLVEAHGEKSNHLSETREAAEKVKLETEEALAAIVNDKKVVLEEVQSIYERKSGRLRALEDELNRAVVALSNLKNRVKALENEESHLCCWLKREITIKVDPIEVLNLQVSNLHGLANTYRHDIEKIKDSAVVVEVEQKKPCIYF